MLLHNVFTLSLCLTILSTNLIVPINAQSSTPTISPTIITQSPTIITKSPTIITKSPSETPTKLPTKLPTKEPTRFPTKTPTRFPTKTPSKSPSPAPTSQPTLSPTYPTKNPTKSPSKSPTTPPTSAPTTPPTSAPTPAPSNAPTSFPTFHANKCVNEHTTWQDWNYIYPRDYISKRIQNDIIMLDILPQASQRQFLFNYESDMVFTDNTLTWFELEYKCADNNCYHYPLNIYERIEPIIYIYNQNNKYIALQIFANKFKISNGASNAGWNSHSCSQSLASSGIKLVNDDITNVISTNSVPKWSSYSEFGFGLDRSRHKGGLMDGTIQIRFRNDELTQKSYLNIRIKYANNLGEDTSYLCAIDDAFTANSNISFAIQGGRNNDPYYIKYINIKSCSGYWDIPRVWCEKNELEIEQYNAWNKNNKNEIANGIFIHGLFNRIDKISQIFTPLVAHESVTIEFDLYFVINNTKGHSGSYFKIETDEQIMNINAPDTGCNNGWDTSTTDADCSKHISYSETTSDVALDLKIYFYNPSMIHNNTIYWGFSNLCINQTYKITDNPTPSPTDPPTMILSDCNKYKTRLSDWDLLYNTTLTDFIPNGMDNIQFSSIGSSLHMSDWLFGIDTNLCFPYTSNIPIWLNIEMNGFGAITHTIDYIHSILNNQ